MNTFWKYFYGDVGQKLGLRFETFKKIFEHLDAIKDSILIVETGCARIRENWAGDGQSTILFDKYISNKDEHSLFYSVDIDKNAIENCRSQVSVRTQLTNSDSVAYLSALSKDLLIKQKKIDLLYLDSYDVDMNYWYPSAAHHLKELLAIRLAISEKTLVVIDDCPLSGNFIPDDQGKITFTSNPIIGGKGRLVAEYANSIGANLLFAGYQAGWTNLR
jgi:hypothetical protein